MSLNLTLLPFCASIFCVNKILNFTKLFFLIFVIFLYLYKAPNNSIGSNLKSLSKFEFYSSESLKLQEKLNNINRNTSLVYFVISELKNKSFIKFYLFGDKSLNPGPYQIQFSNEKIGKLLKLEVSIFAM